jgi:hypothetical protein
MYMPELGRWGVVDPLSERSRKWSSYTYGYDNPLIFIDPDGMFSDFYNTNGDKIGTDGTQETKKYIVLDDAEAKRIQESTTPVSRGSVKSSIENPSDEVVTKAGKVAKAAQGGEEHGFVGSITTLGLFTLLFIVGIRVSSQAKDKFGSLITIGVMSVLFWHMFVNMGMTTGILPIVGIPLPLVSYGGSSLMTTMVGMGLVSSVGLRRFLF